MKKQRLTLASLGALLLLGPAACIHHGHHGAGPPPHAPAHGYRHHHDHHGVDLVWDAHLGVYAVVGFPSLYFWDGYYYRYHDGFWQTASRPRGSFKPYRGHVPPGLAKKHGRKHHGTHKKFKRGRGW